MIKIKGLFITILALVICLAGCKSKQDTLKFIYENVGLPNKECASYEVNIGNKVGGANVVAELWQHGECTKSTPLILNNETAKIYISVLVDGFGAEDDTKGLNVQIETDEISGSILTYFELPTEIIGYSFTAYDDKEVINVTAGKELLLGAMAFDTGDGVRTVDCKSLIDEPEKIKDYSCILIIRAAFAEEQINPQSETMAGKS